MAVFNPCGKDLGDGSLVLHRPGDSDIRRALIEADREDCMVALPGEPFYRPQIPVCLWFLAKNKNADAKRSFHQYLHWDTNRESVD
jgi:type I restriction enzyme M protein